MEHPIYEWMMTGVSSLILETIKRGKLGNPLEMGAFNRTITEPNSVSSSKPYLITRGYLKNMEVTWDYHSENLDK